MWMESCINCKEVSCPGTRQVLKQEPLPGWRFLLSHHHLSHMDHVALYTVMYMIIIQSTTILFCNIPRSGKSKSIVDRDISLTQNISAVNFSRFVTRITLHGYMCVPYMCTNISFSVNLMAKISQSTVFRMCMYTRHTYRATPNRSASPCLTL